MAEARACTQTPAPFDAQVTECSIDLRVGGISTPAPAQDLLGWGVIYGLQRSRLHRTTGSLAGGALRRHGSRPRAVAGLSTTGDHRDPSARLGPSPPAKPLKGSDRLTSAQPNPPRATARAGGVSCRAASGGGRRRRLWRRDGTSKPWRSPGLSATTRSSCRRRRGLGSHVLLRHVSPSPRAGSRASCSPPPWSTGRGSSPAVGRRTSPLRTSAEAKDRASSRR
jgi:hypothetical protein